MPFAKGSLTHSIFPAFLLPSPPFPNKKLSSQQPQNQSTENACEDRTLRSHFSYIRCARCGADICHSSQIISKGFTGRHGRAYLVSGDPPPAKEKNSAASLYLTTSLSNTITQKAVPRQLVTGAHTVCDVSCVICGSVLGWKYIAAEEESQRYKIGNFILETKRISTSSCWEFDDTSLPTKLHSNPVRNTTVEFDSQDEDECEDLFAGIWSPGLATRRKSRKMNAQRQA